jgi:hypothetical protein
MSGQSQGDRPRLREPLGPGAELASAHGAPELAVERGHGDALNQHFLTSLRSGEADGLVVAQTMLPAAPVKGQQSATRLRRGVLALCRHEAVSYLTSSSGDEGNVSALSRWPRWTASPQLRYRQIRSPVCGLRKQLLPNVPTRLSA